MLCCIMWMVFAMRGKEKKRGITLRIPSFILSKIDKLIEAHVFKDRSHYFTYVVSKYLDGLDPVQDLQNIKGMGNLKCDRLTTVHLPVSLVEKIDKAIEEYKFGDRGHALRACAIRHLTVMRLIGGV